MGIRCSISVLQYELGSKISTTQERLDDLGVLDRLTSFALVPPTNPANVPFR